MRYIRFAPGARSPIPGLLIAALLLCLPASANAAGAAVDKSTESLLASGAGFDSVTGSERVRELQRTLTSLGHRPGPIDGLFGPLTKGGVERFQLARGLAVDGVVGSNTGRELRQSRTQVAGRNGDRANEKADATKKADATEKAEATKPGAAPAAPEATSAPKPAAGTRADNSGETDDGGLSWPDVPAYVLALVALGVGGLAGLAALARRRSRRGPDEDEPVVQGGAVAGRLVVAGESTDRAIGQFRGHAQAFAVTWGAQPELRYLVIDSGKSEPFWVSMEEIERMSRLPNAQVSSLRTEQKEAGAVDAREESSSPEPSKALGYASVSAEDRPEGSHFRSQADTIEVACEVRDLELLQVVRDIEPQAGSDLKRPGLMYALETIAAGEASCLVVSGLDRLARSASDLGTLVEWFEHNGGRLVAVDLDLDTDTEAGQTAARALVAAGELDRRRLAERTKKGLAAARAKGGAGGRPAVSDKPALRERISKMRGEGMTLQAIADALNDEGVPTLRGGAEWRPSSVQAAAGYKRPPRNRRLASLPSANGGESETGRGEGG